MIGIIVGGAILIIVAVMHVLSTPPPPPFVPLDPPKGERPKEYVSLAAPADHYEACVQYHGFDPLER